jgi:hypothetical protein
MLSAQKAEEGLLLVTGSSDINSSVVNDTNCFLPIRGNLLGHLTIELGAKVIVEGSVAGKIINRGGRREVLSHLAAAPTASTMPSDTNFHASKNSRRVICLENPKVKLPTSMKIRHR